MPSVKDTRDDTPRRRAGIYVRISDDREGEAVKVGVQEKDCRVLAGRYSWAIAEVYVENDTSAFKRKRVRLLEGRTGLRVIRPAFRRMLDDLEAGVITAVVAYDLDRVVRDHRDLEDLIDVVEQRKIPTAAVTGSLDLSTDAGITMARVMVAMANKSSRDTARRVSRKHLSLAETGRFGGGGRRPYGYEPDGMTIVEDEAAIIRELAERVIAGESLTALALDLEARGVPTVHGSPWQSRSVHSVVSKSRNAGLREYRGEVVGQAAWPAILSPETLGEVKGALADRARGSNNRFVAWLTGVLRCSLCERPMIRWRGPRQTWKYWCAKTKAHAGCGKISIEASRTEAKVEDWILAFLTRPDVLAELTAATSQQSTQQARADAAADEAALTELAQLWGARQITTKQYLKMQKLPEARLKRSRAIMNASTPAGVRKLLAADDIPAAWAGMDPSARRDVAHLVFPHGIRVLPSGHRRDEHGGFMFEPERLEPIDGP
jgi:DNA invertase Pin-like site-specific DNA recombinase